MIEAGKDQLASVKGAHYAPGDEKDDGNMSTSGGKEDGSVDADVESLPQSPEPMLFPDGGARAWATVAGSFILQFTCFGYIGSFGVYQAFYVREYLSAYSSSDIGWIGGIQICLMFTPGLVTGRLFDRGYFYYLIVGTILLYSLALFMLSISHEGKYYQVFLTNGVALGLASGLTFSPSLAIIGHYFKRRRPLAVGIATSGAALGAIIHPIMLNKLINGPFGFHNAVRVSGAMNVTLQLIAVAIMRTRTPPKAKSEAFPIVEWLRQPPFLVFITIYTCSAIPCIAGLFYPIFYIQLNAVTHGVNSQLAFYSVSIFNAGSICGRIIPGAFAHKLGTANMAAFFTLGNGIVILTMIAVHDFAGTAAFGVVAGIFSGATIALTPSLCAQMANHPNEVGTRIGLYFGVGGFIGLFATPILGALLHSPEYHWTRPALLSGIAMTLSGVMYVVVRTMLAKKHKTNII